MIAQPFRTVTSQVASTWLAASSALGGLLWGAYGVLEMLQPWGQDTVYRDALGYEAVADALLYPVYSLPGSLALLMTALVLLGEFRTLAPLGGRASRIGVVLAWTALALGGLSVVGVAIPFDPLFTAPRIAGTLALGAGMLLAGIEASRTGVAAGWSAGLMALGILGLFLLPLWPLVHAIALVPEAAGAGVIALFGLGWVLVGCRLWCGPSVANHPAAGAARQVRALAR